MKTLRTAALSLALSLTAALAHATPTNLVLDGDFESPNTDFPLYWSYTGDNFTLSPDGTQPGGVYGAHPSSVPHPSNVYMDLTATGLGHLMQNITGLTIGDKYTLSFDVQRWSTTGRATNTEILVKFGSLTITDLISSTEQDWITITLPDLVATATSMILDFGTASNDPTIGNQLDNISLLAQDATGPTDPTDVPEPATLGLIGAGLALMGASRRRFART
jgi:hypothetical protein